jgi:hypothetical protein
MPFCSFESRNGWQAIDPSMQEVARQTFYLTPPLPSFAVSANTLRALHQARSKRRGFA